MLFSTVRKIKLFFIKKKIRKNPLINPKDSQGLYLYKKDNFTLRYRIQETSFGKKEIQWISYKCRLSKPEKFIYKTKIIFRNFPLYFHIRPAFIIPLLLFIIVICVWGIIPESNKAGFYQSVFARVIGVGPEQIEYKGGGWFEISGRRIIPEDRRSEPLTITINPFRWLFFSDFGYIRRWRGKESGGYKTYYLEKDAEGRIITRETGREAFGGEVRYPYVEGRVEGDRIKWVTPEGGNASSTDEIRVTEEGVHIIDR